MRTCYLTVLMLLALGAVAAPRTMVLLVGDTPSVDAGELLQWLAKPATMSLALTVDGKTTTLPMQPVILSRLFTQWQKSPELAASAWMAGPDETRLFVPLPSLAQSLGITYTIDAKAGVITLRHPKCAEPLEGMLLKVDTTFTAKMLQAERRSKEATLTAMLAQFRNAIAQYEVDTGRNPAQLRDLFADVAKIGADWKGPYIAPATFGIGETGIPRNPFADNTDTDVTHHWLYDAATGTVTAGDLMHRETKKQ